MLKVLQTALRTQDAAATVEEIAKHNPIVYLAPDGKISFKGFDNKAKRGKIDYFFGNEIKTEDQMRKIIVVNNARIQEKIAGSPAGERPKLLGNYKTLLNVLDIQLEDPSSYEAMKKSLLEKASNASRTNHPEAYLDAVDALVELKKRKATAKKLDAMKNKQVNIFKDKKVGGTLVQELLDGEKIKTLMQSEGILEAMSPAFLDVLHGIINNKALDLIKNLRIAATTDDYDKDPDVVQLKTALIDPVPRKAKAEIKLPSRLNPQGGFIKGYEPILEVDPLNDPEKQSAQFVEDEAKKKAQPVQSFSQETLGAIAKLLQRAEVAQIEGSQGSGSSGSGVTKVE